MNREHIPVRRHGIHDVETYEVFQDELDRIESEGSDLGINFNIGVAGLTSGLSFLANLLLTPVPPGKIFTVFVVITVFGFDFGTAHMIKWLRSKGNLERILTRVRDRKVGPFGEEGKEIDLSAVAELVSVKPTASGKQDEL